MEATEPRVPKNIKWTDYLRLGLYAFLGLGLEVVLILIESLIFGVAANNFTTAQIIIHWIATIIVWSIMVMILTKVSKAKYGFDILSYREKMESKDWFTVLFLLALAIGISIFNWSGWKVYKEFMNLGLLKFIFQYIYYLVESVLILLVIVFGQKAGELKFKLPNVPWGGILVGLTWGLVHALTKGDLVIGLYGFFAGILYGMTYLVTKKDIRFAYPLIACMFIL